MYIQIARRKTRLGVETSSNADIKHLFTRLEQMQSAKFKKAKCVLTDIPLQILYKKV